MKTWYLIWLLLPCSMFGQYDFDTRYFRIDATALPEVPELSSVLLEWNQRKSNNTFRSFSEYKPVTASNYREIVDMATAIEKKENFTKSDITVKNLNQKFSVWGGKTSFERDGSTKVVNTVYKEQRGLDLVDPCPPFGICPRCAPYRVGRGF